MILLMLMKIWMGLTPLSDNVCGQSSLQYKRKEKQQSLIHRPVLKRYLPILRKNQWITDILAEPPFVADFKRSRNLNNLERTRLDNPLPHGDFKTCNDLLFLCKHSSNTQTLSRTVRDCGYIILSNMSCNPIFHKLFTRNCMLGKRETSADFGTSF